MILKVILFIASLGFFSCSNTRSQKLEFERSEQSNELVDLIILNCNGEKYSLEVVYFNESKYINVFNERKILNKINIPSQLDYNGFSLNGIIEIEKGFVVSIEYGSINYYQKEFFFQCEREGFFLCKIRTSFFDKKFPNKDSSIDSIVSPQIALSEFSIIPFLE